MKIGMYCAAASVALLGACASEPHPYKRPLTQEHIPMLANANIVLVENNMGVEATWYEQDTSSSYTTQQYGLIGALIAGGMDAAANGGPSRAAQFVADDIATVVVAETLNKSLKNSLEALKANPSAGFQIKEIRTRQTILQPAAIDGAVEVSVTYKLSQDGSALNVAAKATYQRADLKYKTPYVFKSTPNDELEGPLYRNTFVYESNRLPQPKLTPQLKAAMVETVKKNWIAKKGSLPVSTKGRGEPDANGRGSRENTDFKDMSWEIDQANDDVLLPAESANLLADEWLKSDGAFLKQEIEAAHAYIAKYLVLDLNNTAVPSLTGTTRVVEELPAGRTVRILGSGADAGAYVSSPGGLQEVTTFGNASRIAEKNLKRITALEETAKTQGTKK